MHEPPVYRAVRLVIFESTSYDALEHQLGQSLPDGVKEVTLLGKHDNPKIQIRVATISEAVARAIGALFVPALYLTKKGE